MLDEVRREREAMEREGQMIIEQKQTEMQKEWQQVQQKLQEKMKDQEVQHQVCTILFYSYWLMVDGSCFTFCFCLFFSTSCKYYIYLLH